MKTMFLASAAALAALSLHPLASAGGVEVGVSVQISQPGVYGRIDIGRFPQPQVVVQQPVWVARPVVVQPGPPVQPVYMWVPPGHRKNWRKHCADYGACGVPVYFVRHDWYDQHVRDDGRKRGKAYGKDDRRDDRRDDRADRRDGRRDDRRDDRRSK